MTSIRLRISLVALLALVTFGCGSSTPNAKPSADTKSTSADAGAAAAALPETADEAKSLRAGGAAWTNVQVREHYLHLVARIGTSNEQWKKDGLKAEERAKRAFKMRYDARQTARAMMSDPAEIEELRARDQRRFGNPNGPTYEDLVEKEKKKGSTGDAIYEAIVVSAQRTDPIINELLAPK